MTKRKSRRRRRRRTRRRRTRRRRTRRRRTRRRRGGLSVGMNTVNLQIKARDAYARAEVERRDDKLAINWEKGDGKCYICRRKFGLILREHHCRSCGKVVCDKHSKKQQRIYRWALHKTQGGNNPFRECDNCFQKENDAIAMSSGKTEKVAIAALRRAMFESCNNSSNRKKMIKSCRHRSPPRLPSSFEIKQAKSFQDDEETRKYLDTNWNVRKQINKIYPPHKKEKEKDPGMFGERSALEALGLNRASQRHQKALSRVELRAMAKKQATQSKKLAMIPTAVAVGNQTAFPEAEVVKLGNRL